MIGMVIKSSPTGMLAFQDINDYLYENFACFRGDYVGWKQNVRTTLSVSTCFSKKRLRSGRKWQWTMNKHCNHCKLKIMGEAACKRFNAKKSKRIVNQNDNNVIQVNPTSTEFVSDVSSGPTTYDHPAIDMYTNYYDSYDPFTSSASATSNRQQPDYVDDLANIQDIYVTATDIDYSMYLAPLTSVQDDMLRVYQPFRKQDMPQGPVNNFTHQPNDSSAYQLPTNYQHYEAGHLPTSYQCSHDHYETQAYWMTDSYPYPYGFASTTPHLQSFPSSSSYLQSLMTSVSYDSDFGPILVPTESLWNAGELYN